MGRIDPKLHRDRGELEVKSVHLEQGFRRTKAFDTAFAEVLRDLATFLGAGSINVPRPWRRVL